MIDAQVLNPCRTGLPFWGQITYNLSELSPKRGCGSKGVTSSGEMPTINSTLSIIGVRSIDLSYDPSWSSACLSFLWCPSS